jgi:DNA-binding Lrp family transcriptional regulator
MVPLAGVPFARGVARFGPVIESDHAQARVTRHRPIRPLPAKPQPACGPVQAQPAYGPVRAIARIRLTSGLSYQAFERSIRDIPAVRSAVRVIGDVDYELRLECPDLAHLGGVLTSLRACRGTEVASTVLVTREVEGLGRRARSIADWGTAPRPRQTRSA